MRLRRKDVRLRSEEVRCEAEEAGCEAEEAGCEAEEAGCEAEEDKEAEEAGYGCLVAFRANNSDQVMQFTISWCIFFSKHCCI